MDMFLIKAECNQKNYDCHFCKIGYFIAYICFKNHGIIFSSAVKRNKQLRRTIFVAQSIDSMGIE